MKNHKYLLYSAFVLVLASCTNMLENTVYVFQAPTIKNVVLSNVDQGILLRYQIDVFEGFKPKFSIYRGESTWLEIIGETNEFTFIDHFPQVGKRYFYQVRCTMSNLENQSFNSSYNTYFSTSDLVISEIVNSASESVDFTNFRIYIDSGKVHLDWDDIEIQSLTGFTVFYSILKRPFDITNNNYANYFDFYYSFINSEYVDTSLSLEDLNDTTWYYQVTYFIANLSKSIIYYGKKSNVLQIGGN